jgi:twinkle protein
MGLSSTSRSDESSNFIAHEPCPSCGSKDNLGRFDDGHGFCFGCNYYEPTTGAGSDHARRHIVSADLILDGKVLPLEKRNISADTCEKFGYTLALFKGQWVQVANYHSPAGDLVAQKVRFANKDFTVLGDLKKAGLFGAQLWGKGKMIVITEGEIDALTVAQVQGLKWPVVSVPNGAAGAKKAIAQNLEYLNNFETVVLMFDSDAPGKKAAQECAEVLGPTRCKIATLPLKDPNEMLMAGRTKELVSAMWDARPYQPEGVLAGSDLLETVLAEDPFESIPYQWEQLNKKTYGMRQGELITICAGTGIGKSAVVRELAYHLGNTMKQKVGLVMLEENTKRSCLGLMGIHANRPLHINRKDCTPAQMTKWFNESVGNGNYWLIDHFGSTESDTLFNRIRYLVTGLDCKWIILDHLSIVVSGIDDGDERKAIDVIMTRLRTLVEELGFGLILVSHLKGIDGKGHENGAEVQLSHLRGSRSIGQLSDLVIALERDQQGDNPNVTIVRLLKNRFSGELGIATYLQYDRESGRLWEVTNPEFLNNNTVENGYDATPQSHVQEEEIPF